MIKSAIFKWIRAVQQVEHGFLAAQGQRLWQSNPQHHICVAKQHPQDYLIERRFYSDLL